LVFEIWDLFRVSYFEFRISHFKKGEAMRMAQADFLRGKIRITRGSVADYRALAHLHYVPGDPATFAGVWKAEFEDLQFAIWDLQLKDFNRKSAIANRKLIAVAVLLYPVIALRARHRALGLSGCRFGGRQLRWLNGNVRTIARVIVHPQFRALGLASALVRRVLRDCPTRYVEAVAAMGAVHPFFVRAGMTMIEPVYEDEAAYFLFDRRCSTRGGGR
jgi:GNAT superfamily N-acetyltransferase